MSRRKFKVGQLIRIKEFPAAIGQRREIFLILSIRSVREIKFVDEDVQSYRRYNVLTEGCELDHWLLGDDGEGNYEVVSG